MKYLKEVLDELFGAHSSPEKDMIIEAVNKDNKASIGAADMGETVRILEMFKEIFNKPKTRVMSKKVVNRYKKLLKVYSIKEIEEAMRKASQDKFHIESGYKHLTLEYFSRDEMMDKWVSYDPKQIDIFNENSNFSSPIL
jgi:hypothetical protein